MYARLCSSSSSSLLRNRSSLKWLPEGLPGCLKSLTVGSHGTENVRNLGKNVHSLISRESFFTPYALSFRSFVHSSGQKDNETWRGFTNSRQFVKGIIEEDNRGLFGGFQHTQRNAEQDADFVHIKLMRNNTFVTVTDSKGNKKFGASSGCLSELKGGPKMSKYAAEATAEHVGRLARNLGLKSVVVRVKGFTYFKKKRQAILSFREGFSGSRTDENPIICIEDATRRPHNGCRLPKRRRI